MNLSRYSIIEEGNKREIVLLKSRPCIWSRCTFCDYIHDNEEDNNKGIIINKEVLKNITGVYKKLEIINSGSCFELPEETLLDIKKIADEKQIEILYFESHYIYRKRLDEIRNMFSQKVIFKCGVETFDTSFREKVLKKGMGNADYKEIRRYFSNICLLVGIKGQTKEMIDRDINIGLKYFDHICVNIYIENTTSIKADKALISWFKDKYYYLRDIEKVDVLFDNTDYGVGGMIE